MQVALTSVTNSISKSWGPTKCRGLCQALGLPPGRGWRDTWSTLVPVGGAQPGRRHGGAKQGGHVASSQPLGIRCTSLVERPLGGVQRAQDLVEGCSRLQGTEQPVNWLPQSEPRLYHITKVRCRSVISGASCLCAWLLSVFPVSLTATRWLQQLQAPYPYISSPEAGKRDCPVSHLFFSIEI